MSSSSKPTQKAFTCSTSAILTFPAAAAATCSIEHVQNSHHERTDHHYESHCRTREQAPCVHLPMFGHLHQRLWSPVPVTTNITLAMLHRDRMCDCATWRGVEWTCTSFWRRACCDRPPGASAMACRMWRAGVERSRSAARRVSHTSQPPWQMPSSAAQSGAFLLSCENCCESWACRHPLGAWIKSIKS